MKILILPNLTPRPYKDLPVFYDWDFSMIAHIRLCLYSITGISPWRVTMNELQPLTFYWNRCAVSWKPILRLQLWDAFLPSVKPWSMTSCLLKQVITDGGLVAEYISLVLIFLCVYFTEEETVYKFSCRSQKKKMMVVMHLVCWNRQHFIEALVHSDSQVKWIFVKNVFGSTSHRKNRGELEFHFTYWIEMELTPTLLFRKVFNIQSPGCLYRECILYNRRDKN